MNTPTIEVNALEVVEETRQRLGFMSPQEQRIGLKDLSLTKTEFQ